MGLSMNDLRTETEMAEYLPKMLFSLATGGAALA
jgi:hypothetical protein